MGESVIEAVSHPTLTPTDGWRVGHPRHQLTTAFLCATGQMRGKWMGLPQWLTCGFICATRYPRGLKITECLSQFPVALPKAFVECLKSLG